LRNSKFQLDAIYRLIKLVICKAVVSLHKIHNIERACRRRTYELF